MNASFPVSTTAAPIAETAKLSSARVESIPWYIWLSVAGVTSAMIGVHWDIAWHRSIGRDTFWTPAHIAIQLCGVIAGITCGYLILWTTFTKSALRAASVNVLGFRAPLGAFICAWGGFTMIASAPFDDWWHNAYGLDVKILSPPHVVLAIGMIAVELGTLVLVASTMNRSMGRIRKTLEWLELYVAGMIVIALLILVFEFTYRVYLHTGICYRVVSMLTPIVLVIASRVTGDRWAATKVAGIYSAFLLGLLWILPRFPAEPKLGPVRHEIHQFIPAGFPLLIIAPAIVLDWLWPRMSAWRTWQWAFATALIFVGVFWAVEWPFADFLQSPYARNAFFGSSYYDYFQSPQGYAATYRFVPLDRTPAQFYRQMLFAVLFAFATSWAGLGGGNWLKRVRR
jgi:hypothetical protein